MRHIFYLLAILPIIWESIVLTNPMATQDFFNRYRFFTELGVKLEERPFSQIVYSYFSLFYMLWIVVGLFSSQWDLFCGIIFLIFIPRPNILIHCLDALITLVILVFILLNVSYLHIDVWYVIKHYIQTF